MKEPVWESATEKEVWEFAAVHLKRGGVETVLVGGAAAAVYSEGAYRSGDLDLVKESYSVPYSTVEEILRGIGFTRQGKHFAHPRCRHIIIEFVSGPVAVGEDTDITPERHAAHGTTIKILSPTDCIKDRLASYIFFKSRDALEQAVLVARRNRHDTAAIRRWCASEGKDAAEAFREFRRLTEQDR